MQPSKVAVLLDFSYRLVYRHSTHADWQGRIVVRQVDSDFRKRITTAGISICLGRKW